MKTTVIASLALLILAGASVAQNAPAPTNPPIGKMPVKEAPPLCGGVDCDPRCRFKSQIERGGDCDKARPGIYLGATPLAKWREQEAGRDADAEAARAAHLRLITRGFKEGD